MIDEIIFVGEHKYLSDYRENTAPMETLKPISKINFFVGTNNAGKSRFIRYLLQLLYQYRAPNIDRTQVKMPYEEIYHIALKQFDKSFLIEKIVPIIKEIIAATSEDVSELKLLITDFDSMNEFDLADFVFTVNQKIKNLITSPRPRHNQLSEKDEKIKAAKIALFDITKAQMPINSDGKFRVTYVPILRTLRKFIEPIDKKDTSHYLNIKPENIKAIKQGILRERIFFDYFIGEVEHSPNERHQIAMFPEQSIFSGERLFETLYNLKNGTQDKRKALADFEHFLGKYFFDNRTIELHAIKKGATDEVFVTIGQEKEFPIYLLGDGIQAIILMTFPLFYFKNDTQRHLIFYEEPELHMHPGMQRIFVEALRTIENAQAFVVTHSNHILDTSLDYKDDISIFSFEKVLQNESPVFHIENLSSPDISLLNLLGVRNSSVFLSNCCIWVEGISDRIYLKKYLELWTAHNASKSAGFKRFYEDLHFSFIEFGGSQVAHYDFSTTNNTKKIKAKRITNRILLIHDKDKSKQKRHTELKSELKSNYYPLPVLEIENLLTPDVLKKTLLTYKKYPNKSITFKHFTQKNYEMEPIGEFMKTICDIWLLNKISSQSSDSSTSKILNKAEFARRATSAMDSWELLSKEAKELTKYVYSFIKTHNP